MAYANDVREIVCKQDTNWNTKTTRYNDAGRYPVTDRVREGATQDKERNEIPHVNWKANTLHVYLCGLCARCAVCHSKFNMSWEQKYLYVHRMEHSLNLISISFNLFWLKLGEINCQFLCCASNKRQMENQFCSTNETMTAWLHVSW